MQAESGQLQNADYAATEDQPGSVAGTVFTYAANGVLSIDGNTPVAGESVLLPYQTDNTENSIYTVTDVGSAGTPAVLTQRMVPVLGVPALQGTIIRVGFGAVNGGKTFQFTQVGAVLGVDQTVIKEITPSSGVYTPTLSIVANLDSAVAEEARWLRIGAVVTVFGAMTLNATAAATQTAVDITLPVPSNLANNSLNGVAAAPYAALMGAIFAQAPTCEARLSYVSTAELGDVVWQYSFSYSVI
jgi:hypothetical protein